MLLLRILRGDAEGHAVPLKALDDELVAGRGPSPQHQLISLFLCALHDSVPGCIADIAPLPACLQRLYIPQSRVGLVAEVVDLVASHQDCACLLHRLLDDAAIQTVLIAGGAFDVEYADSVDQSVAKVVDSPASLLTGLQAFAAHALFVGDLRFVA